MSTSTPGTTRKGRPPLDPDHGSHSITLNVTTAQRDKLRRHAAAQGGTSMSAVVRQLIDRLSEPKQP